MAVTHTAYSEKPLPWQSRTQLTLRTSAMVVTCSGKPQPWQ
jgi:hypothetical protein